MPCKQANNVSEKVGIVPNINVRDAGNTQRLSQSDTTLEVLKMEEITMNFGGEGDLKNRQGDLDQVQGQVTYQLCQVTQDLGQVTKDLGQVTGEQCHVSSKNSHLTYIVQPDGLLLQDNDKQHITKNDSEEKVVDSELDSSFELDISLAKGMVSQAWGVSTPSPHNELDEAYHQHGEDLNADDHDDVNDEDDDREFHEGYDEEVLVEEDDYDNINDDVHQESEDEESDEVNENNTCVTNDQKSPVQTCNSVEKNAKESYGNSVGTDTIKQDGMMVLETKDSTNKDESFEIMSPSSFVKDMTFTTLQYESQLQTGSTDTNPFANMVNNTNIPSAEVDHRKDNVGTTNIDTGSNFSSALEDQRSQVATLSSTSLTTLDLSADKEISEILEGQSLDEGQDRSRSRQRRTVREVKEALKRLKVLNKNFH
jgi:hypothetical protein